MSHAARVARALLIVPLLALAASCARVGAADGAGSGMVGGVSTTGVDASMLDAWADFPVGRKPRPIVLIGQIVEETGYRTDDAKMAVAMGRLQLDAALPKGPSTVPVTLPDGTFKIPVITGERAYDILRAHGDPGNGPGSTPTPLRITRVTLGTATFRTDRGPLALPAWLFEAPDSLAPLAVPALADSDLWRPGENGYPLSPENNTLARDGVTLTTMLPAPERACPGERQARFVAEIAESSTAVVVGLRSEPGTVAPGVPVPNCAGDLVAEYAPYTVRLATPLGNRVVIGPDGHPLPVIGEGPR